MTFRGTSNLKADLRGLFALVLGLLMALRLIAAPAILSSPEPGVIALCTGTQVIYVNLSGEPVQNDEHSTTECPFFGITAALPVPAAIAELPVSQPVVLRHQVRKNIWHANEAQSAYHSRAPPRYS